MVMILKEGQSVCPKCNGKGLWERDHGLIQGTCLECYGRGWVWEPKPEEPEEELRPLITQFPSQIGESKQIEEEDLIAAIEKIKANPAEELSAPPWGADFEDNPENDAEIAALIIEAQDKLTEAGLMPEPNPMTCPKCGKPYLLKWRLDLHVAKCRK